MASGRIVPFGRFSGVGGLVVAAGRVLGGRFRLEARLGAGGFGAVWRGVDERLSRPVAVKVLLEDQAQDPAVVKLFRREAELAAKLTHPGITTVHDFDVEGDLAFLVMELLEGESLEHRLARSSGGLPVADVVGWIAEAAEALAAAHRAGMVHRDIKPANLMVLRDERVKVCDFGIARAAGSTRSVTAKGMGTADYIAPEQLEDRPVDGRTDLYSLGCTLYHLLAGRPPFTGDTVMAILAGHMSRTPEPLHGSDIPDALSTLVARLMAKDPKERPADAAEAARLLGEAMRGPEPVAPPAVPAQVDVRPADVAHPEAVAPVPAQPPEPESRAPAGVPDPMAAEQSGLPDVDITDPRAVAGALEKLREASEVQRGNIQREMLVLERTMAERRAAAQRAGADRRETEASLEPLRQRQDELDSSTYAYAAPVLAREPARHVRLHDAHGIAQLLVELKRADAWGQVEQLLDRDPARRVCLDDSHGISLLIEYGFGDRGGRSRGSYPEVLSKLFRQWNALLERDPVSAVPVDSMEEVARFLLALRRPYVDGFTSEPRDRQLKRLLARDPAKHVRLEIGPLESWQHEDPQWEADARSRRDNSARHLLRVFTSLKRSGWGAGTRTKTQAMRFRARMRAVGIATEV